MAAEKTAINLLDEACDLVSCWRAMWQPFAKSLQSCPTLCDPINVSPPDSPVPGILQARTRVGCHFLLQCVKVKLLSHVQLFATPWTAAYQGPLSMGFSRQEYWNGLPLPSPTNSIEWAPVSQTIREDNVICVSLWI